MGQNEIEKWVLDLEQISNFGTRPSVWGVGLRCLQQPSAQIGTYFIESKGMKSKVNLRRIWTHTNIAKMYAFYLF